MPTFTDNPVVRAAARAPASVQRKLLAAFALVVVLLVTVGALGLNVLSQSNSRADALGQLPERLAKYLQLEVDTNKLAGFMTDRDLPVICLSQPSVRCPAKPDVDGVPALYIADGQILAALSLIAPLTQVNALGFVPPNDENTVLARIRSEYEALAPAMTSLIEGVNSVGGDEQGDYQPDQPLLDPLEPYNGAGLFPDATSLVTLTQSSEATLIAQDSNADLASQHLFIGVAAGSAVLALVLGIVLSWTIVGPVKKMQARLAAIGSGDFSEHVHVDNRDELGALAADLNRMNDELGRLVREVEAASKHKSEFLANMSHELRTPLNAVIGFSDVLQDQMFGELNEKQMEYVNDIHTSGRHLLTLTNDILDLSKIEAGRLDLEVASFSLPEVLQNSVALMRERATRQGIILRLDVDPSIGIIEADERLLKQILFNLLSNALNFTNRDGHVDVVARDDGEDVVISVRDDGAGIAPADQARIFEEFEQAGKSKVQPGTGLGLALSRRFVELQGGGLTVKSALGQGSTFTFNVPKTHAATEPSAHSGHAEIALTTAPSTP